MGLRNDLLPFAVSLIDRQIQVQNSNAFSRVPQLSRRIRLTNEKGIYD